MLSSIEAPPIIEYPVTTPEVTAAVNEVYADLALHGIGSAFDTAGRVKNVRSFNTSDLPEGAAYLPHNPAHSDDIEVPDFLPHSDTLDNLTPYDEKRLATIISHRVGVAQFVGNNIAKLTAPDVGVHRIRFPDTQTGIKFLEQHGYRVVLPHEPSTQFVEKGDKAEKTWDWFSPVPATYAPAKPPLPQRETFSGFRSTPEQAAYEPSQTEQYLAIRHALLSQLERKPMRTELGVQFNLDTQDIADAYDAILDIKLHNELLDLDYKGRGTAKAIFDKRTSTVIKAALEEFVRLAPRGPEYDAAIREGRLIPNVHEASQANQIRAMRNKLTICHPDSFVPRRRSDAESTQLLTTPYRATSTRQFKPLKTRLAQSLDSLIPDNLRPGSIKQKLMAVFLRHSRKAIKV